MSSPPERWGPNKSGRTAASPPQTGGRDSAARGREGTANGFHERMSSGAGRPLPPAVILGGSFNAVSVARSLSAIGVEVRALGDGMSAVRHSRCCDHFADLGRGEDVQARWMQWLEDEAGDGAVLLPCDDDALELLASHRPELLELGYRPFEANDRVLTTMLDKDRSCQLARRLGVRAPRTVAIRSEEDLGDPDLSSFSYPCALKPVRAHHFAHAFGQSRKAFTVHGRDELEARLGELIGLGIEMLVTEIVPGDEDQFFGYYSYIDAEGRPLFGITKRKLRQFPPVFGFGCYHVTGADPEVAEVAARFLLGAGVLGLANVELKRDSRDGELTFIECNHRFTAINELLRIAGADLAAFTYARLVGLPTPSVDGYRSGVRLWHPLQDTRAAIRLRRAGALSFGAWLHSIAHRQHTPLFSWRDPGPSVGLTLARARRNLRRGRQS
jgi:D-aspartate ligase